MISMRNLKIPKTSPILQFNKLFGKICIEFTLPQATINNFFNDLINEILAKNYLFLYNAISGIVTKNAKALQEPLFKCFK